MIIGYSIIPSYQKYCGKFNFSSFYPHEIRQGNLNVLYTLCFSMLSLAGDI
jgi:hypothetical protein